MHYGFLLYTHLEVIEVEIIYKILVAPSTELNKDGCIACLPKKNILCTSNAVYLFKHELLTYIK